MLPNKIELNRIKILKGIIFAALAIILVRLFFIQIVEHGDWVAKAEEQHTLLETITAKRGEIYMMDHGEPVAVVLNQTTYQIVIDPTVTKKEDIEKIISTYAKDYSTADLNEIYNQEGLRYSIVARNIPHSIAEQIVSSETPAIWLKKTNQRVYPEGELAANVLGFVNADGIGQYGVEGAMNDILAGKDGLLKTTADINKVALSIGNDNVKIPAEDGKNVILSIDRGFEQGVEELTKAALANSPATNAAVLAMDPNTGEVLAMANLPSYNPSDYGNVKDTSSYINYTTEVPYEPASVCKSFTFSAAINEGRMNPDTTYVNHGYEIIDNQTINNAEKRASLNGAISMRTALYWSLNTGSIHALKLLGNDTENITAEAREKLYDYYYNKFRLGQPTGIELYEAEGFVWDPHADIYGLNAAYANMTFGQNLSLTMIQVASAFSAVVNGGTYHAPTVVKGTKTAEQEILSNETSATMRSLLVNNRSNKVLRGIDRPGYSVGGKTGTAQVIKDGAYTMDEYVGSYAGFVGTNGELPKIVIMVKIWGEGQHIEGNKEPMSLFDSLSNYAIDYFKIKPGV
ncbi:penicillin-binding protein 2 [Candidatus Saccharibacteria bacterium]|nr:penicillin-binding protein 2 [Candidatus Saccharibacteria bacterium]